MKPVALSEFFIKLHTKPGNLALDPFMESGTTGVAGGDLGRNFMGVELDRQWYEMTSMRSEQETRNKQSNEGSGAGVNHEADQSTDS